MKRLIALVVAALAVVGISFAQPAAAFTQTCRETHYGDGAKQSRVCFTYFLSSDGTWQMTDLTVWNIPLSQGGHTDSISPYIRFFNGRMDDSGQAALDGGSYYNYTTLIGLITSQTNTMWIDYRVYYGSSEYCKRVFVNKGGGTSEQNITCVN
jgi:hypothetical protein